MPAILAPNSLIARALNDNSLASQATAELMHLVARKSKSSKKGKSKIKVGPIVGIIIGIIILIIIVCIILFLLKKRKQKKQNIHGGQMQPM